MPVSAIVQLDSISIQRERIISVACVYPWQIHGELMTHRRFSRNASSNRAVPIEKMIAEVRSDEHRAYPSFAVHGGPGMQGGPPMTEAEREEARADWRDLALYTADWAEKQAKKGRAKQDINRALMPYTHARVLVTSTEWANFDGLRLHKAADPTMRALAIAIWEARKASTPTLLQPGEWHLPYVDAAAKQEISMYCFVHHGLSTVSFKEGHGLRYAQKVSVARSARISYKSFPTPEEPDGKISTVEKDIELYDKLMSGIPLHASPAEHQATPDTVLASSRLVDNSTKFIWANPELHGNLQGWIQFRKTLKGEDRAPIPEEFLV